MTVYTNSISPISIGLSSDAYSLLIKKIREREPEIEEIILFGSRAIGNYKQGSDVDLAIGGGGVSEKVAIRLSAYLNLELSMPYKFDVVSITDCSNDALVEHIKRFGKKLL